MRKLFILVLAIVLLTGCNSPTGGTKAGGSLVDIGDFGEGFDLVRDTDTGCIYIYETDASYSNPITPYFNEEGKVEGCGEEDFDKSKYE